MKYCVVDLIIVVKDVLDSLASKVQVEDKDFTVMCYILGPAEKQSDGAYHVPDKSDKRLAFTVQAPHPFPDGNRRLNYRHLLRLEAFALRCISSTNMAISGFLSQNPKR